MTEKTTPYSVHPSVSYARSIVENLPAKTGRSMDQWCELLANEGPLEEKKRADWLRKQHKLGGTTARMIAERSVGGGRDGTDPQAYLAAASEYVAAMYSGRKAPLRAIHDRILERAGELPEVRICPCKTIVPLYRNHVFAEIKPATQKRLDLGLALAGCEQPLNERLIDTGGLARKDRITHRFPLESPDQVDAEINDWLTIAWQLDS